MKYAALILNALALLLLGWVLYGVLQLTGVRAPAVRPVSMELMPLAAATQIEQGKVAEALEAMRRMAPGNDVVKTASANGLLSVPAPGTPLVGSVQMPQRSMSLHLENVLTDKQTVVIDNRLVQRGDRLTEGGRVLRVRPNEATVAEKEGKQTLMLPVNDMRVGTLRWADGSPASISTKEFRSGLPGSQPAPVRSLP